ncbi:uncharacterized protein LOC134181919 [Corticium candelabrum]|uniref:uncharacterized protein LOC134181919 n=1 Tax=Corticium candelabrum TaxID=121492 RepID=UPI002E25E09C|nr:uncharacterized protein LOC134181919 [Corticium candelabrum]
MGCAPSFPCEYRPIAYEPQYRFTDTGLYVDSQRRVSSQTSFFHLLHTKYWENYINERKRRNEAKSKFRDTRELHVAFPMWSEEELLQFRIRFQLLDWNGDGLVDDHDVNHLLDELGYTGTAEERNRYFGFDPDGSDSIDFVTFLQIIQRVQTGTMSADWGLGALCSRNIEDNVQQVQRLSVLEQMAAGVF